MEGCELLMYDYVIIGGGIVGLAVGMAILNWKPNAAIAVLEKEKSVAAHQTGHNSGVIHSGIYYINCAGLYSDRIAKLANIQTDLRIVPFRGEYYQLKPEKRYLVKNLIYPVPNPNFPFLGVHFTRMIDGTVDVGPNAVLSFKREGYLKTDFSFRDTKDVLFFKGFWKLASRYAKEGIEEMARSFSKRQFVKNVQQLMPDIEEDDLLPGPSGVRAQALKEDGTLVDDFYIVHGRRSIHVLNAPSPAATASIEIGKEIVRQLEEFRLAI